MMWGWAAGWPEAPGGKTGHKALVKQGQGGGRGTLSLDLPDGPGKGGPVDRPERLVGGSIIINRYLSSA